MARRHADKSNRFSPIIALLTGLIAALSLLWALPALAGASDYCVAPKTGCTHDVADFQTALDQAHNNVDADQIFLGATTYTAPTTDGYTYDAYQYPVEIVGAGEGQTILTSPADSTQWVLYLDAGAGSSVHDLTIALPQNVGPGFAGLTTTKEAKKIEVVEDPAQSNLHDGVQLGTSASSLEDSSVSLGGAQNSFGVMLLGGGTVDRSSLSARVAMRSLGDGLVTRSRLIATEDGLQASGAPTIISSSLIRLTGPSGTGISATVQPGEDATVKADGVTVIGTGTPNSSGVFALTSSAGQAEVDLSNSILRNVPTALTAYGTAGAGPATINASYSDYDASGNAELGGGSINETNVTDVGDAGFVDPANGDFRLRPDSPLVDTGDPASPQGLDLDGNPLVVDGDSDGIDRRDMGAFELQPPPPPPPPGGGTPPPPAGGGTPPPPPAPDTEAPGISGFHATPKVFAARTGTASDPRRAHSTRFAYTLSEDAKVRLTFQRILASGGHRKAGSIARSGVTGSNSVAFRGRVGKRILRAGRYRVTVTAIDGAGNHSAPRVAGFRIAAG